MGRFYKRVYEAFMSLVCGGFLESLDEFHVSENEHIDQILYVMLDLQGNLMHRYISSQ